MSDGSAVGDASTTRPSAGDADDGVDRSSVDDQVLDAARSCILEFGVKRTTLAEIARRAKVSRPTVYRRWADTRAVVSSLLTREIASVMPHFDARATAREQIVSAVSDVGDRIRLHPLFVKILHSDSDVLATYILHRLGTSQNAIIDSVTPLIAAGQADSSIRDGTPSTMATVILLMVQSAVQSADMVAERVPGTELIAEFAYAVDAYLRPTDR